MDVMDGRWKDYAAAAVALDGPWSDYAPKTPGDRAGGGARALRQHQAHDIDGSTSYDSSVAQAKEAPISDPPGRPDRPEIADYPHGTPTDAGRITETIDGAPINPAATVVGRAMGGGPESNVSPGEVAALVRKITGHDHQIVPADQMAPSGTLGSYRLGDRLTTIDGDLEPRSAARVLAHELGHAIEHERWPDGRTVSDSIIREMMRKPKIEDELRFVYNDLNNPYLAAERNRLGDPGWAPGPYDMRGWRKPMPQSGPYYEHYGPEDRGYQVHDVHSELMVEALRAYMTDPNYFKTVAPGAAAAIRNAINRHPRLSEIIQFNMAPLAIAGGSGATAAALSAGDEAQAGPAARAFLQQQARRSPADAREHEAEVLRRFGYSDDDISAMTPEQRAGQAAQAVESGISTARDDDSGSGGEPPKPLTPDATDFSDKRRSEIEGLIRAVHGQAHPDDVALAGMLMHRHGLDAHDAFEHATLVNALRAGDISPGQMASVIGTDRTDALRQAALLVGELHPA